MVVLNADMERTVIDQLPLSGRERVLEVGFGPGVGLRLLARRLPEGLVAGIDPSPVMIAQATRRVRRTSAAARLDLREGTVSSLPWDDGCFDAVCSVNNIQLWPSLEADLNEVRRVLRAGGTLAIGVHRWALPKRLVPDADDQAAASGLRLVVERAGLEVVHAWLGKARAGAAVYLVAKRRPEPGSP
jgi:ubiquinone/menaquinone biosynthesis C-methylase UbiE